VGLIDGDNVGCTLGDVGTWVGKSVYVYVSPLIQ